MADDLEPPNIDTRGSDTRSSFEKLRGNIATPQAGIIRHHGKAGFPGGMFSFVIFIFDLVWNAIGLLLTSFVGVNMLSNAANSGFEQESSRIAIFLLLASIATVLVGIAADFFLLQKRRLGVPIAIASIIAGIIWGILNFLAFLGTVNGESVIGMLLPVMIFLGCVRVITYGIAVYLFAKEFR